MMVSTRGRYALRLIIDIAKQGQAGALVTMRQSAERLGLSVKYLEQLGGALVRGGVLKSIRGVNGGYYLDARLPKSASGMCCGQRKDRACS